MNLNTLDHVALWVADRDAIADFVTRHAGMISSDAIPGMVRVAFEKEGLVPAPNYLLLEYGRTPAQSRDSARSMLIARSRFTRSAKRSRCRVIALRTASCRNAR